MLTSTLTLLGCALVLALSAGVFTIATVSSEADLVEARRQKDRVEAALESQSRMHLFRMNSLLDALSAQDLTAGNGRAELLRQVFPALANRFLDLDGAYLVDRDENVMAGVENHAPAGEAGYRALRHLEARPARPRRENTLNLVNDRGTIVGILSSSGFAEDNARHATGDVRIVAYRQITADTLQRLAQRYRIEGLRIVPKQPVDQVSRLRIAATDGSAPLWITWAPGRPGAAMRDRFGWALLGLSLVFLAIFAFVCRRLAQAADGIAARETEIARLAAQDDLSQLPNRRAFNQALRDATERPGGTDFAVILIDLDRFKAVNDTHGHHVGDLLLREVALRLRRLAGARDMVARLGGDEFAMLSERGAAAAEALCDSILASLREPFAISGLPIGIGCSVGAALHPGHGSTPEHLLKRADIALYQSKSEGRNRALFFQAQMNHALSMRRTVEDDLRKAIAGDQLLLHYQPIVSADGGRIVGVEALVRWNHPLQGLIPPADFIALAEERGLIVPLSEWVLNRACRDAGRWPGVRLAVNISPVQFRQKDFVEGVLRIVAETGFDPACLELELTEGVVIGDADAAEAAMMDLRAHGMTLALDDFGTGYSSLIYLRRFAFDKIKIDRSFLESMEPTGESAILVHSMTHLGRALGLRVCAEGVETADQQRFLQAVGCNELQGYLFSRPVAAAEIDRLVALESPFPGVLAA